MAVLICSRHAFAAVFGIFRTDPAALQGIGSM
jgi:hypothetical protein